MFPLFLVLLLLVVDPCISWVSSNDRGRASNIEMLPLWLATACLAQYCCILNKLGSMLLRVTPVTGTTITTSSKFSHATFNTHLGTKKRYALNSFNTKATTTWTQRTFLALSSGTHANPNAFFPTETTHTLLSFSDIFREKNWCHLPPGSRYIDVGAQLAHDPSGIGNAHTLHCNALHGSFSRRDTSTSPLPLWMLW